MPRFFSSAARQHVADQRLPGLRPNNAVDSDAPVVGEPVLDVIGGGFGLGTEQAVNGELRRSAGRDAPAAFDALEAAARGVAGEATPLSGDQRARLAEFLRGVL